MKSLIIILLICTAIFTTYWFWLRVEPMHYKTISTHIESSGSVYVDIKNELSEWFEILGRATPILSLILAFVVKRRKK